MKRVILIVFAVAVAAIVAAGLIFHSHWSSKIDGVVLPEGAETIETKVSLSDVYGPHMLAEKIVGTEMTYEELVSFVEANNDGPVSVFRIHKDGEHYSVEWDDWALDPDCIKGKEADGLNYYLVSVSSPYGSLFED